MKTRTNCTECGGTHDDCQRAEVERLRAAVARGHEQANRAFKGLGGRARTAEKECERLREALEQIVALKCGWKATFDPPTATTADSIAHAADRKSVV